MVEAGVTPGPRIFSTGYILYGAEDPNRAKVDSLDDARKHLRRIFEAFRRHDAYYQELSRNPQNAKPEEEVTCES